jgi:hypothetical protein
MDPKNLVSAPFYRKWQFFFMITLFFGNTNLELPLVVALKQIHGMCID